MSGLRPTVGNRKQVRLKGFDYSSPGAYSLTICCSDMRCLFGRVRNGKIELNSLGRIVECEIRAIADHHNVAIGESIVMPNHIHLIVVLDFQRFKESLAVVRATACADVGNTKLAPSVAVVMRLFKQAVTRAIRKLLNNPDYVVWQRGFHEHIIRDEDDLLIRSKFRGNPQRWELRP